MRTSSACNQTPPPKRRFSAASSFERGHFRTCLHSRSSLAKPRLPITSPHCCTMPVCGHPSPARECIAEHASAACSDDPSALASTSKHVACDVFVFGHPHTQDPRIECGTTCVSPSFGKDKRAVIGVFFGVATPIVLEINFLRGAKTDAAHLFRDAAHDGGKDRRWRSVSHGARRPSRDHFPLFFDAPKPTSSSPFNGGSVALRQESNCCVTPAYPVSSILLTASRYSAAATSSACARMSYICNRLRRTHSLLVFFRAFASTLCDNPSALRLQNFLYSRSCI